jgi:hypothetical protein
MSNRFGTTCVSNQFSNRADPRGEFRSFRLLYLQHITTCQAGRNLDPLGRRRPQRYLLLVRSAALLIDNSHRCSAGS